MAEQEASKPEGKIKHNEKSEEKNVCEPIKCIEEIWNVLGNPPKWTRRILPLMLRSPTVVDNKHLTCHYTEWSPKCLNRQDAYLVPRTLICHDMKNGYLEDRYLDTVEQGNGYTFYRWSQIDIFVYFSHHFITIPPLNWINNAHRNGVKILGTFITEWNEGIFMCKELFKDLETMKKYVNALVELTILFNFDGWLLNIENKIENTSILLEFVKTLTETIHRRKQGSLVIWYDSVIMDGTLKWQNELNSNNRGFFDACDGIFLNYTWTENNMITSAKVAQHRLTDVYVGIDVFGRNTYGGGKFNAHVAAEKIRSLNMSMAIFAQGWTHEGTTALPVETFFERFLRKDNGWWRSIWPYLYTHPINTLFDTFFNVGADKYKYALSEQQIQLSRFLHSNSTEEYDSTVPTLMNQCNCLQLHLDKENTSCLLRKNNDNQIYIHHLFTCDIIANHDLLLYTFTQPLPGNQKDFLNVILLVQENGAFRKIICNSIKRTSKDANFTIQHIYPCDDNNILDFSKISRVPERTTLRCYHIEVKATCRILEISGEIESDNSVVLCGIGLQRYSKYVY